MSIHIAMLLSNPFRPDPRVHKEARSLVEAGYKVTVICWDRQADLTEHETIDGIEIRRLVIPSGYGVGGRQVFHLPRFWRRALRVLRHLQPDIIHCHDLDTAPAGFWYARAHGLPWIFDAHECYPEQVRGLRVNRFIYCLLLFLERQMTRRASYVITIGSLLAQRFRAMGGRVAVVGNYQPLADFNPTTGISRAALGLRPEAFVVAYIGGFTPGRVILPLIRATQYAPEVIVLLLGDGPQRKMIEAEISKYPRARYLGRVPPGQVPNYTALADVIYYGLNHQIPDDNIHYSSPNALFNALAAGKPLLTGNLGEIARIVQEEQCGLIVEPLTPESLADAIKQLRDPAVRAVMSINARRAAQEKYNWQVAAATLLRLYQQLNQEKR
ncbi:MAG: glycosyltransferase family 4 protein [candidate division KSB1 bacterium]|nr:glycosyltransferase family 4 protein [candidate division KSB1 bacterium]MDZ7366680.1 glycosyltransferase family 4 protein [candidate division KSB1 bacterium]MDZ7404690.1 glycosyltransferase family 4 protein [candidate division KSB1 bacterium]